MITIHSYSELLLASELLTALFFLSWIGFGYLATRTLRLQALPWGQTASIGIAVLIFLGGIQAFLGTVSVKADLAILMAGFIFFLAWLKKSYGRRDIPPLSGALHSGRDKALAAAFIVLRVSALALMGVRVAGALYSHWWNIADDMGAYFVFPKMMLQTHTLMEPFNLRRLATFGGSVYLQTFLYPLLNISALPVTDAGLGGILIWAVTLGFFKNKDDLPLFYFKREIAGLVALFVSSALILKNYNPVLIPSALILCLVSLCLRVESAELDWRHILLLSLLCGALITIRNNYIALAGVFIILYFASRKDMPRRALAFFSRNAVFFSFLLLYLLPWMLLLYRSDGTLFFPLMKGNFTFPNGFSEPLSLREKAAFVWGNVLYSLSPLIFFPIFFMAFFFKRSSRISLALATAVLSGVVATSLALTASNSGSVERYCQPFTYAGLLALFIVAFAGKAKKSPPQARYLKSRFFSTALFSLFLILLWFNLPYKMESVDLRMRTYSPMLVAKSQTLALLNDSQNVFKNDFLRRFETPDSADYYYIQRALPYGSHVLSATDQPYYWDFRLQDIHTLDLIGWASPPPGMPFFQGAGRMVNYFRDLGYQYLVYTPSDVSIALYSKKMWSKNYKNYIWNHWAPYIKDYINNIKQLETEGAVVYSTPYLRVISLDLAAKVNMTLRSQAQGK